MLVRSTYHKNRGKNRPVLRELMHFFCFHIQPSKSTSKIFELLRTRRLMQLSMRILYPPSSRVDKL
jgi:hypothetical protein